MITDPDAYFAQGCGRCARFATPDCSTRRWLPGLLALRRIAQAAGLAEVAKWGHPVYMHAGRNVAILGAFRDDFRLTFFDAALLADPERRLTRQGPNSATPDCLRYTDAAAPDRDAARIAAFLAQAMAHAAAGRTAPRREAETGLPGELVAALDADPALAEAFAALTPGRQRSWALQIAGAKTAATRAARVERARARIFSGKGATER